MIINGKELSLKIKEQLKNEILSINEKLSLCVIQIGENEASDIYINKKAKLANELNINFSHIKFSENEDENTIKNKILELNNNSNVTGIIIQLPIPRNYDTNELINLIDSNKDIDGLTNTNRIKLLNNEDGIIPCTPLGIVELLDNYNIDVEGKNVVIIGRSNLVSKPLFNLLLNRNATLTMCHSKTTNLEDYTKKADILVSATGKAHLIKEDMVKENSIIIDVGISYVDGKIYGDVDYDNVKDKVSYITPVPGGVGPMTVIMLMKNLLNAYNKQKISK